MSCITVLGLLIGARTLEKGRGLFIATGISTGFCGGNWTEGEGADIVQSTENRTYYIRSLSKCEDQTSMKKADLCNLEASDLTCRKRCRNVGHGYRLQNDTGHREM